MKQVLLRWLPASFPIDLALVGLAAATAMGFGGGLWWMFDLFSHFRFHYASAVLVVTCIALFMRRWRRAAAGGGVLVINLWLLAPLYMPFSADVPEAAPRMKVMQVNVHTANNSLDEVAAHIRTERPDLVSLQEVNARWVEALTQRLPGYRFAVAVPRPDNFGIALLMRREGKSITVGDVNTPYWRGLPMVEATITLGQTRWRLLSVHTLPPVSSRLTQERDAMFEAVATWVEAQDLPCVVVGDLNATPWSYPMRRLLAETKLRNSQLGFGLQGTWPAFAQYAGMIPIDHCLHTSELVTTARARGPNVGSDHRPLTITVAARQ